MIAARPPLTLSQVEALTDAAEWPQIEDMTDAEALAWGDAELAFRIADSADRSAEGFAAAQRNATERRKAIGATASQAADLVIRAGRARRVVERKAASPRRCAA